MTTSYQLARRQRFDAQDAHWAAVQQLPARAQAGALFALWPHKLPKRLRRLIKGTLLDQWRALRRADQDKKMEAFHQLVDQMLFEMEDQRHQEMLIIKHESSIEEIHSVLNLIPNIECVTVVTPQDTYKIDLPLDDDDDPLFHELSAKELNLMLAVALDQESAGVVIRQTSPLRTQVTNAQGQMEWQHQQRVYGMLCGRGQWKALTDKEMRQSYIHDPEGNLLPHDPLTTFGNFKDYAKKALGSRLK